jgi:hypothetical protein
MISQRGKEVPRPTLTVTSRDGSAQLRRRLRKAAADRDL